jgi:plastocyanin
MTKHNKIRAAISAACIAGGALFAAAGLAGPEKIAYPAGWEKWERYGVVSRYDSKRYHELYARSEIVNAVREGKPIPDGAVLVLAMYATEVDEKGNPVKDVNGQFKKSNLIGVGVMEKRKGWGAEYPAEMRNGEWEFASFLPDGKPNEKTNAGIKACFMCHKPHEKQDYVMSLASLSGTALGAARRPSGPGTVAIAEFLFGPEKITVKQGQTITWTNVDDSPHQVTVQGETTLRTPVVLKGQSTALKFDYVGTYGYICGLHPAMKGQIEVTR